jgi:hypothetical protein
MAKDKDANGGAPESTKPESTKPDGTPSGTGGTTEGPKQDGSPSEDKSTALPIGTVARIIEAGRIIDPKINLEGENKPHESQSESEKSEGDKGKDN